MLCNRDVTAGGHRLVTWTAVHKNVMQSSIVPEDIDRFVKIIQQRNPVITQIWELADFPCDDVFSTHDCEKVSYARNLIAPSCQACHMTTRWYFDSCSVFALIFHYDTQEDRLPTTDSIFRLNRE